MPQDKNYGQPNQPHQPPRNVPGHNPGQKPPQNPGQNPGQRPGQNPGFGGGKPGQGKPQGYAEQKGEMNWTNQEIETLKELAQAETPVETICIELNKPEEVIVAKAQELQITLI